MDTIPVAANDMAAIILCTFLQIGHKTIREFEFNRLGFLGR